MRKRTDLAELRAAVLAASMLLLVLLAGCGKGGDGPAPCAFTSDCADGLVCVGGTCRAQEADAGTDGSASCPAGQRSCGGSCVDTASDPAHCGACGNACPAPAGATATCEAGRCAFACEAGRADCDGDPANGCETDTSSDPAHCGACETVCPEGANATASCAGGSCGLLCQGAFEDCDGNPENGCEADTSSDPAHCGTCGRACMAGYECAEGECVRSPYGAGSDGPLVLSRGDQVSLPAVAARVQAEAGANRVTVLDDASFAPGQLVMLHQSREGSAGSPVGTWRLRVVQEVTSDGAVVLDEPLDVPFATDPGGAFVAQMLVVPQHTTVRVGDGATLRARPWNGRTGGILALVAREAVEVAAGGRITASAAGFRGGPAPGFGGGEGQRRDPGSFDAPVDVGGGADRDTLILFSCRIPVYLGGGGGHTAAGAGGSVTLTGQRGTPFRPRPYSLTLTAAGGLAYPRVPGRLWFGGGGGAGGTDSVIGSGCRNTSPPPRLPGGAGGGVVYLAAPSFAISGTLEANGARGALPPGNTSPDAVHSGSGAGGTLWIRTEGSVDLGANRCSAQGGAAVQRESAGAPGRVIVEGTSEIRGTSVPPAEPFGS